MPVELNMWRVDGGVSELRFEPMENERKLEDVLDSRIDLVSEGWLVVGRQVRTDYDKFIDLLALDRDGNVIVLELKKGRSPRDVVAQLLDYGSWVRALRRDRLARIYADYHTRFGEDAAPDSIDEAFQRRFGTALPEEVNESHELVIAAAELDPSTERIVNYLHDEYGVRINVAFFRFFRDGDREYLSRAWLVDPTETATGPSESKVAGDWNGEYYASFGMGEQVVDEGLEHGFICAGGGEWYSKTLGMLEPGARVWANVPTRGYVGVGIVEEPAVPVDEFAVEYNGSVTPVAQTPLAAGALTSLAQSAEDYYAFVRVRWIATASWARPIKESGFFGNQNSVARPRSEKWQFTVERLAKRFDVPLDATDTSTVEVESAAPVA